MGHQVADGRDKGIGIIDFHGINTAGVPIDEIVPREGQSANNGLPAIRAGKNPAIGIQDRRRVVSIKASHASHGACGLCRRGVVAFITRIGRGAHKAGIKQQDLRGSHIGAVVPDVGEDGGSIGSGKIDPHAARRIIDRIQPHVYRLGRHLACRRVGPFAGGHGHDLLAHDHEAVVEDAAQHDQEDRQDEGEFDKGLALAPAPLRPDLLEVRERLHGSFGYMFVC